MKLLGVGIPCRYSKYLLMVKSKVVESVKIGIGIRVSVYFIRNHD